MLSAALLERIDALGLDIFQRTAIIQIVEDAIVGNSGSLNLCIRTDWPADFEVQWWAAYPRKHDKKTAMRALNRIAKEGKTSWAELIEGTAHYGEITRGWEQKHVKHPATFLNAESWRNRYNRNHERPASFYDAAQSFWEQAHGK